MIPESHSLPLLDTALNSIFVDKVDWSSTYKALLGHLKHGHSGDSEVRYRVLGMGPGAESLVTAPVDMIVNNGIRITGSISDFVTEAFAESIAVVGLSVNYPSGKGRDQFWDMLEQGKSAMSEVCLFDMTLSLIFTKLYADWKYKIPESRFDLSQYHSEDAKTNPRKMGIKYGNFLEDPYEFDPAHFNVSPREAKSIDPQQRLLLRASVDALEDAGYAPDTTPSFQRDSFGVYVGVATGDYVDNLRDEIDVYYSPGMYPSYTLVPDKTNHCRHPESFLGGAHILCSPISWPINGI